jgi:hypothetical protein
MAHTKRFGGDARLYRAISTSVGETSFLPVDGVTDLAESGGETNMINTTTRDDIALSPREIQTPALIAATAVDFTIMFDIEDPQHVEMTADAEARAERNFQIRQAGIAIKAKFRGFQKALPKSYPMTEMITARTGIALSGPITYAV